MKTVYSTRRIYTRPGRNRDTFGDFVCQHCGASVSAAAALSGVRSRNHCPYCLASRHLDQFEAGDRLSACKAVMHPVGLTLKRLTKKYAGHGLGELMLVHQCADCGKISINRVAADDVADRLLAVMETSATTPALLAQPDIMPLTPAQAEQVRRCLLTSAIPELWDE